MKCQFKIVWYGKCQKDSKLNNIVCEEHSGKKCVICGNQALEQCGFSKQFVCGEYLCGNSDCEIKHMEKHF